MLAVASEPLRIGKVVLTVRDLDATSRFYEEVVGLHRLSADASLIRLGTDQTVLLELRRDPQARSHSPREAGLFHTAFLLPSRADLGQWALHAARGGCAIQGAADHGVSEAIYLADPERNGVEIYADRPRETWVWSEGMIGMVTDPLDTDGLMRAAGAARWSGVPRGSVVGHVHLQVGSVAAAEAFYGGVLGFDLTCRYPGASFYSSGGYHHHVATNIWNSRNAGIRDGAVTGLAEVEIVASASALAAVAGRRVAAETATAAAEGGPLRLRDPWGTSISLVPAEA